MVNVIYEAILRDAGRICDTLLRDVLGGRLIVLIWISVIHRHPEILKRNYVTRRNDYAIHVQKCISFVCFISATIKSEGNSNNQHTCTASKLDYIPTSIDLRM